MIIKYREYSEVTELHSDPHKHCTHQLEEGWQCCCEDCYCEAVIKVNAAYAFNDKMDHEVIIKIDGPSMIALTPDRARELASLLYFAAIDAETLNKDFPND
jgi:hypothetical protein